MKRIKGYLLHTWVKEVAEAVKNGYEIKGHAVYLAGQYSAVLVKGGEAAKEVPKTDDNGGANSDIENDVVGGIVKDIIDDAVANSLDAPATVEDSVVASVASEQKTRKPSQRKQPA